MAVLVVNKVTGNFEVSEMTDAVESVLFLRNLVCAVPEELDGLIIPLSLWLRSLGCRRV